MRSRYSAFAVGDANYLVASWAPEAQVTTIDLAADQRWSGLTIHETTGGGPFERTGTVRFTARYESEEGPGELTEISLFRRHGDQWVYVGPANG